MASDLVNLDDVKEYINVDHDERDSKIKRLISLCSNRIREYIGSPVITEEVTDRLDGGVEALILSAKPLVSISEIKDVENDSTLDSSEYDADLEKGLVYRPSKLEWLPGRRRWKVTYEAGYGSNIDDVPDQIQLATMQYIAARWDRPDDGKTGESQGDWSYQAKDGLPEDVKEILAQYKDPSM